MRCSTTSVGAPVTVIAPFEGSRDLLTRLASEGDGLKDHARG